MPNFLNSALQNKTTLNFPFYKERIPGVSLLNVSDISEIFKDEASMITSLSTREIEKVNGFLSNLITEHGVINNNDSTFNPFYGKKSVSKVSTTRFRNPRMFQTIRYISDGKDSYVPMEEYDFKNTTALIFASFSYCLWDGVTLSELWKTPDLTLLGKLSSSKKAKKNMGEGGKPSSDFKTGKTTEQKFAIEGFDKTIDDMMSLLEQNRYYVLTSNHADKANFDSYVTSLLEIIERCGSLDSISEEDRASFNEADYLFYRICRFLKCRSSVFSTNRSWRSNVYFEDVELPKIIEPSDVKDVLDKIFNAKTSCHVLNSLLNGTRDFKYEDLISSTPSWMPITLDDSFDKKIFDAPSSDLSTAVLHLNSFLEYEKQTAQDLCGGDLAKNLLALACLLPAQEWPEEWRKVVARDDFESLLVFFNNVGSRAGTSFTIASGASVDDLLLSLGVISDRFLVDSVTRDSQGREANWTLPQVVNAILDDFSYFYRDPALSSLFKKLDYEYHVEDGALHIDRIIMNKKTHAPAKVIVLKSLPRTMNAEENINIMSKESEITTAEIYPRSSHISRNTTKESSFYPRSYLDDKKVNGVTLSGDFTRLARLLRKQSYSVLIRVVSTSNENTLIADVRYSLYTIKAPKDALRVIRLYDGQYVSGMRYVFERIEAESANLPQLLLSFSQEQVGGDSYDTEKAATLFNQRLQALGLDQDKMYADPYCISEQSAIDRWGLEMRGREWPIGAIKPASLSIQTYEGVFAKRRLAEKFIGGVVPKGVKDAVKNMLPDAISTEKTLTDDISFVLPAEAFKRGPFVDFLTSHPTKDALSSSEFKISNYKEKMSLSYDETKKTVAINFSQLNLLGGFKANSVLRQPANGFDKNRVTYQIKWPTIPGEGAGLFEFRALIDGKSAESIDWKKALCTKAEDLLALSDINARIFFLIKWVLCSSLSLMAGMNCSDLLIDKSALISNLEDLIKFFESRYSDRQIPLDLDPSLTISCGELKKIFNQCVSFLKGSLKSKSYSIKKDDNLKVYLNDGSYNVVTEKRELNPIELKFLVIFKEDKPYDGTISLVEKDGKSQAAVDYQVKEGVLLLKDENSLPSLISLVDEKILQVSRQRAIVSRIPATLYMVEPMLAEDADLVSRILESKPLIQAPFVFDSRRLSILSYYLEDTVRDFVESLLVLAVNKKILSQAGVLK